jgi:hypothetical protein
MAAASVPVNTSDYVAPMSTVDSAILSIEQGTPYVFPPGLTNQEKAYLMYRAMRLRRKQISSTTEEFTNKREFIRETFFDGHRLPNLIRMFTPRARQRIELELVQHRRVQAVADASQRAATEREHAAFVARQNVQRQRALANSERTRPDDGPPTSRRRGEKARTRRRRKRRSRKN